MHQFFCAGFIKRPPWYQLLRYIRFYVQSFRSQPLNKTLHKASNKHSLPNEDVTLLSLSAKRNAQRKKVVIYAFRTPPPLLVMLCSISSSRLVSSLLSSSYLTRRKHSPQRPLLSMQCKTLQNISVLPLNAKKQHFFGCRRERKKNPPSELKMNQK